MGRKKKVRILVLNGPNLNLLGVREPDIYGSVSLGEVDKQIFQWAEEAAVEVEVRQSNSEGQLVDWIQEGMEKFHGLVINPAAYTHTSVALRDAVLSTGIPTVEVHLSNIYKRESFRRRSYIAGVALGQVSGFGATGYLLALQGLLAHIQK